MKKSELIMLLVDKGDMSILEAEKIVITQQQFISKIEAEKKEKENEKLQKELKKEIFRKRTQYEYNRQEAKANPFNYEEITLTYEEAVDYKKDMFRGLE